MALADNEMILKNVRITTFGQQTIYTAKSFPGGNDPTEYFSLNAIIPKDHPQIPQIEKMMLEAAIKKFGEKKAASVLKAAKLIGKVPFRDGDAKADYDGFEGNMFLSARTSVDKGRPTVFDNLRNPVVAGDPNSPYDGSYCDLEDQLLRVHQRQQRHRLRAQGCAVPRERRSIQRRRQAGGR